MYNEDVLRDELILDYKRKLSPYRDSMGNWFIGVRHPLVGNELIYYVGMPDGIERRTLTQEECQQMLAGDIQDAENKLDKIMPGWRGLDEVRQRAIMHLAFDLGNTLRRFIGFLRHIEDGQWSWAATTLRNSNWFRLSGKRGARIVKIIRSGREPNV